MLTGNLVGVAFSGGGAFGCAHDGVLAYLVEMNIPIDVISGVSIGSNVGGSFWFVKHQVLFLSQLHTGWK